MLRRTVYFVCVYACIHRCLYSSALLFLISVFGGGEEQYASQSSLIGLYSQVLLSQGCFSGSHFWSVVGRCRG